MARKGVRVAITSLREIKKQLGMVEEDRIWEAIDEEREEEKKADRHYVQWSIEASGTRFRPTSRTRNLLPKGMYAVGRDDHGLFIDKETVDTSELILFEDSTADDVIQEFDAFWSKAGAYEERGEAHKRGFMLWGPPGGGKTSTVAFITKQFIDEGNVCFRWSYQLTKAIKSFREIEKDRKIMVVIEDIDSLLLDKDEENQLLQFLDGNIQHRNTIVIATTNYPERLPDRIMNRPSRFDRVTYVGTPTENDRRKYIETKAKNIKKKDMQKWLDDTNGWTVAYIKELILSVEVFDLGYDESLERLNTMRKKSEHSQDYEKEMHGRKNYQFGFNASSNSESAINII